MGSSAIARPGFEPTDKGRVNGRMAGFRCHECEAIYRDLLEAASARDETAPDRRATPNQVAGYLESLDEDDCARMREMSPLWKAWRRREEHRALTGHSVSLLPLQPGVIENPA